jgi:hypothetical protein
MGDREQLPIWLPIIPPDASENVAENETAGPSFREAGRSETP